MERTREELKDIAMGIFKNDIFISSNCPPNLVPKIFLPLSILSEEEKLKFINDVMSGEIQVLFEEMNRAIKLSINGFPIFSSFKTLSKNEWVQIIEMHNKITDNMGNI